MRLRSAVLASVVLLTALNPARVSAQGVLDRVVGPSELGTPLQIWGITGQHLAILGKAAGVAVGFEGLVPSPRLLSIVATGQTLRNVLDAVVAADPRYEWREADGVIVVRPIAAWANDASPLHASVEGFSAVDITAGDALDLLAQMVGGGGSSNRNIDSRRFSVTVPERATWLEMLNAIVRAHGTMGWEITPSAANPRYPLAVTLFAGSTGMGVLVRADAVLRQAQAPHRSTREPADSQHLLDRIVGTNNPYGQPFRVSVVIGHLLKDLSGAAGVPIGFESLPDSEPRATVADSRGITLTGMTLRQALDVIVAIDPRYEWRDQDGIVVMRPARSWEDVHHPLFQVVANVRLDDITASRAIAEVHAALTGTRRSNNFPDTRTFSADLPSGTVLDLINEICRAHGELSWEWTELPPEDRPGFGGRYQLAFWLIGGSYGQQHVVKGLGAQ